MCLVEHLFTNITRLREGGRETVCWYACYSNASPSNIIVFVYPVIGNICKKVVKLSTWFECTGLQRTRTRKKSKMVTYHSHFGTNKYTQYLMIVVKSIQTLAKKTNISNNSSLIFLVYFLLILLFMWQIWWRIHENSPFGKKKIVRTWTQNANVSSCLFQIIYLVCRNSFDHYI